MKMSLQDSNKLLTYLVVGAFIVIAMKVVFLASTQPQSNPFSNHANQFRAPIGLHL